MSRIVVLGAGVCGLAAGILLCRDGHEVTVLERDGDPVPRSPEEAWESWPRTGVTQFRQTHFLTARGRAVLEEALPDALAALEAAGGFRFNLMGLMPPSISDHTPRDGDERFETVTARRSTVEAVLCRLAAEEPGLEIRRGVSVGGLVVRAYHDTPHVTGVLTDAGELSAELVVDAMGRRSQLPRWLSAVGAEPVHEEAEDSGFIYYTRYFRSVSGAMPEFRAPLNTPIGTLSALTIPADNGTWSITITTSAGDQPLKRLRDPGVWTAALAACPAHAHWLDGEPTTGVMAMGGVVDRYRRLSVGGRPVATGVALLSDAWACTNPSQGRGMTLGLRHAQLLVEVAREHLEDPHDFAAAWDAMTEAELTPWYRETVEEDRTRMREIEALRHGLEPEPPDDTHGKFRAALVAAVPHDPDAFRAFIAVRSCVTRHEELFADPSLVERVLELARDRRRPPPPGPDREQLLELLGRPRAAV